MSECGLLNSSRGLQKYGYQTEMKPGDTVQASDCGLQGEEGLLQLHHVGPDEEGMCVSLEGDVRALSRSANHRVTENMTSVSL